MHLYEILDKAEPYEVTTAKPDKFYATAKIGGRDISFAAESYGHLEGKHWWELTFMETTPIRPGMKKGTYALTGSGSEFRVFATLRKFATEFVERYHPEVVFFTADKREDRADVYEKLGKRFKLPGYTMKRSDQSNAQERLTFTKDEHA